MTLSFGSVIFILYLCKYNKIMSDKIEFENLCKRYDVVFDYTTHKPFYVLGLILAHEDQNARETIPYSKYFKPSLFNNNVWIPC